MATIKSEQQILDKGYNAVHRMTRELVKNGASLLDVCIAADEVWHVVKEAAWGAELPGVEETGMYTDQEPDNETLARLLFPTLARADNNGEQPETIVQ